MSPVRNQDAKSLEDLAASFKTQGILAPLLARELLDRVYELTSMAGFSFKASTLGYDVCSSAKLARND